MSDTKIPSVTVYSPGIVLRLDGIPTPWVAGDKGEGFIRDPIGLLGVSR
jgi:hypothetical protein